MLAFIIKQYYWSMFDQSDLSSNVCTQLLELTGYVFHTHIFLPLKHYWFGWNRPHYWTRKTSTYWLNTSIMLTNYGPSLPNSHSTEDSVYNIFFRSASALIKWDVGTWRNSGFLIHRFIAFIQNQYIWFFWRIIFFEFTIIINQLFIIIYLDVFVLAFLLKLLYCFAKFINLRFLLINSCLILEQYLVLLQLV